MVHIFNYKKTDKNNIENLFNEYIESLTGVYDNFLEGYILKSDFYIINWNNLEIGYFAIYDNELLTQFYVKEKTIYLAQNIFMNILEAFDIKNGFVPTFDELFLSLSMDYKKNIEMQAYFFKETNREVADSLFSKSMLRLAILSDAEMIKSLSGGFFDDLYQQISDRKIYVLEQGDEVYGFGIIEENYVHGEYRDIGMFTVEKHRQKGVGRSIVIHLKDLCHTANYKVFTGCRYYDHSSKKTLESCGFITKSRLIKIEF